MSTPASGNTNVLVVPVGNCVAENFITLLLSELLGTVNTESLIAIVELNLINPVPSAWNVKSRLESAESLADSTSEVDFFSSYSLESPSDIPSSP